MNVYSLDHNKHNTLGVENSHNGYANKTLGTEDSQFEINIPRDHQGEFESLGGRVMRVMGQSRNLTTETFLHYALEDFQSINSEIA